MISKKILSLIARYLASECSELEKQKVEKWRSASLKHNRIFEDFRATWELALVRKPVESKSKQALIRLRLKLKNLPSPGPESGDKKFHLYMVKPEGKENRRIARHIMVQVAAGLVALGALMYVTSYVKRIASDKKTIARSSPIRFEEVSTKDGQQATLRLNDGTQILINSASRIRYTEDSSNTRLVYLDGEAYFEVHHSDLKPFMVRTAYAVIKDIGTKFDVRSWPGDGQTQVAVTNGKVSVHPEKPNPNHISIIGQGQAATVTSDGSIATPTYADLNTIVAWIDGKLIFHNEQMQNIMRQLKRKYGLNCYASDPSLLTRTITAYIDRSQSAREVLDIISLSLGTTYRTSNDSVLFVPIHSRFQPKNHYQ